jgi:hypothetical protein
LHPGCFSGLGLLFAKQSNTGFGQDALHESSVFAFFRFLYKRKNSAEPVGKWKSSAAFCGAFPLFHRLTFHGFLPTNSSEEPKIPKVFHLNESQ